MYKQITTIFGTVVCLTVVGCGSSESSTAANTSIEDRRAYGIQFSQQHRVNSKNEMTAKWGRDILAELQAATPETLKAPSVASAVLGWKPAQAEFDRLASYFLMVFWVEDQPSIDEIEFLLPDSDTGISLPIFDDDSISNLEVAKQNVVYTIFRAWEKGTEISERLESLTDWENLKVRLVRDGEAVTDWYPVSFYKDDKWVTNIPNPHREDEIKPAE